MFVIAMLPISLWAEKYSEEEVRVNAEKFLATLLGPTAPTIAHQQMYSGVGNDKEWLTQLSVCLESSGIKVAASQSYLHEHHCKKTLLSDATEPSRYYEKLRGLLPCSIGTPERIEVVERLTDLGLLKVIAHYGRGSIALFHVADKQYEDLGLLRVDYVLFEGITHQVEDEKGNVELYGW